MLISYLDPKFLESVQFLQSGDAIPLNRHQKTVKIMSTIAQTTNVKNLRNHYREFLCDIMVTACDTAKQMGRWKTEENVACPLTQVLHRMRFKVSSDPIRGRSIQRKLCVQRRRTSHVSMPVAGEVEVNTWYVLLKKPLFSYYPKLCYTHCFVLIRNIQNL